MEPDPTLVSLVGRHARIQPTPETGALGDSLRARYGDALSAILIYGSCLRSGNYLEGLVDLYVVVDNYRRAYPTRLSAVFNQLLPPNVYYLEVPFDGNLIRAKYAVVSRDHLRRGTSRRWFHSYLWGRFAQPVSLLYARSPATEQEVYRALAQAVETFIDRTLPCMGQEFSTADLWVTGLVRSYRSELRAEGSGRASELFQTYRDQYERLTRAVMATRGGANDADAAPGEMRYCRQPEPADPWRCRLGWGLRRAQGKLLSILRLTKAFYTFRGGLNYIIWKLERHSGQTIDVPARVRRRPMLYGWGFMWRLYRRGLFR